MQLKILPTNKNAHLLSGILIKGENALDWALQLQYMDLSLSEVTVFALPKQVANSVWGCMVVLKKEKKNIDIGKNIQCQLLENKIYIPENTSLYPSLLQTEYKSLFPHYQYVIHQDFGLVALSEPFDWSENLTISDAVPMNVQEPADDIFVPSRIFGFYINSVSAEETLSHLEKDVFPNREHLENQPLSFAEKMKLKALQAIFSDNKNKGEMSEMAAKLGAMFAGMMGGNSTEMLSKLQGLMEELQKRNESETNRLIDLLKKNPSDALKYAIPIDEHGTDRGISDSPAMFQLSSRWNDFSLFGNSSNFSRSSGGGINLEADALARLRSQYTETALNFIKNKEFEKAAFVYLKLLKDYAAAAKVLEDAKMYKEAASIYLEYCKNDKKAAECYEKGNMTLQAIALYEKLFNFEKVGDLYMILQKKDKAFSFYQEVIDVYNENGQFVKAALIYRYKMNDTNSAQENLLEGWRMNKDAFNCINNYFANIKDSLLLENAIEMVYEHEVTTENQATFLQALEHEFKKYTEIQDSIKNIAYEIISNLLSSNPNMADKLKIFTPNDKKLLEDTSRFIQQRLHNRRLTNQSKYR